MGKIDHKWKIARDLFQRCRGEHLPADRNYREVDSRHLTDQTRPRSGRVQNRARLYQALSCFHRLDSISTDADPGHFHAIECFCPHARCRIDVSHHNAVRVHKAVLLMECACNRICEVHERQTRPDVVSTQQLSLHAKTVLQFTSCPTSSLNLSIMGRLSSESLMLISVENW